MTTAPSILIVDDEPDNCANLSDILGDFDFRVDVAYDGFKALKLVEQQPYDLALLDLKMPGMDGLELYRRIKKLRPGTVAMIVTAYASDATAQAAIDAGAWQVVAKPVDFQKLLRLVDEALGQPLVMIIDDDDDLCDSLWDLFRQHSLRVTVAHSMAAAARQLRESNPQVALIDMRLPEGDGCEMFQMLRETNPQARSVIITGHRGETERLVAQVLAAGADAVCYKPFDVPTLVETVKKLAR